MSIRRLCSEKDFAVIYKEGYVKEQLLMCLGVINVDFFLQLSRGV